MRISHLGFVVNSIELELDTWLKAGYEISIPKTFDPIQNVFCLLLAKFGEVNIELVAPSAKGKTPLEARLKKGGGLDHICYKTSNLEARLMTEKLNRSLIVCEPVYAETFKSRIFFVMRPGGLLVEFLEVKEQ
jgi:methylmalonyl-CoA/ethylmalonyl-CoA epimerase